MERWVGSIRRECLDRLLIVGRGQLEHVLRVYVRHYNCRRPHRALELRSPDSSVRSSVRAESTPPRALQVRRRDLLGGLIHELRARRRMTIEFLHPTGMPNLASHLQIVGFQGCAPNLGTPTTLKLDARPRRPGVGRELTTNSSQREPSIPPPRSPLSRPASEVSSPRAGRRVLGRSDGSPTRSVVECPLGWRTAGPYRPTIRRAQEKTCWVPVQRGLQSPAVRRGRPASPLRLSAHSIDEPHDRLYAPDPRGGSILKTNARGPGRA